MTSQYIQLWKQPQFNIYYFSLCAVSHVVRLFTGAVNPVLSTLLFVVEYGLLSSFIKEPVVQETQVSWSDVIERHREDIIGIAGWMWPGVTGTVPGFTGTVPGFTGTVPGVTPGVAGVTPSVSTPGETTPEVVEPDSDSDDESDDDDDCGLPLDKAALEALLG